MQSTVGGGQIPLVIFIVGGTCSPGYSACALSSSSHLLVCLRVLASVSQSCLNAPNFQPAPESFASLTLESVSAARFGGASEALPMNSRTAVLQIPRLNHSIAVAKPCGCSAEVQHQGNPVEREGPTRDSQSKEGATTLKLKNLARSVQASPLWWSRISAAVGAGTPRAASQCSKKLRWQWAVPRNTGICTNISEGRTTEMKLW